MVFLIKNNDLMGLGKLLLKLYIFSFLLTTVFLFIYSFLTAKSGFDNHLITATVLGALLLNIPLILIAIPGLFMSVSFANHKLKAFVACFITPAALLIYTLTSAKLQAADKVYYGVFVIAFTMVLGYFFYRNLTPNNPRPEKV
jgi:hypothetical protein